MSCWEQEWTHFILHNVTYFFQIVYNEYVNLNQEEEKMCDYKAFISELGNCQNKNFIVNAKSLISATNYYYSKLCQYEELKQVDKRMATYKNTGSKMSITDNFMLLGCFDYIRMYEKKINNKDISFSTFLKDYVYSKMWKDKDGYLIFYAYPELNNVRFSKAIEKAIYKCRKNHKQTDFSSNYYEERMKSIEFSFNTYIKYRTQPKINDETAFNEVLNNSFIDSLLEELKIGNPSFVFDIASARRILTTGEMKNNCKQHVFKIKFSKSYNQLDSQCKRIIKKYSKSLKNIYIFNDYIDKLEANL